MREYSMYFYKVDGGYFLECRQCRQVSRREATKEAELYKAWAEVHYHCKVFFEIKIER